MCRCHGLGVELLDSSKEKMNGEWMRAWVDGWVDDGQTDVNMGEWVNGDGWKIWMEEIIYIYIQSYNLNV